MRPIFVRTLLLACLAVALFGAVPALASEAQTPAAAVAAPVTACDQALSSLGNLTPAEPVESAAPPAWLEVRSHKKFHGYCHCGCVPVTNCNTDADCGGATCGTTISCC
jgi:hypothetical protein